MNGSVKFQKIVKTYIIIKIEEKNKNIRNFHSTTGIIFNWSCLEKGNVTIIFDPYDF
jgi:hypothetical protein